MSVLTRVAQWLGFGQQRMADGDPLVAALTQRSAVYGVGPVTPASAARKVAVGATIRLISNTARNMPAHAYRGEGAETKRVPTPQLLRDPDATGRGLDDWVAQAAWSLAARGNLIVRQLTFDGYARPTTIEVMHPDRVVPDIRRDGELWWVPYSGKAIPGNEVLHTRMFPVPGAVLGLSPIEEHAATVGMGIAAEKFGSDFFESGGHPTGLLKSKSPTPPSRDQATKIKDLFRMATRNREPVVMPADIDYEQIQIAPDESQFLDAQGYSSAECARIFGPGFAEVLGYETGGSMTYSNMVDRDLSMLKYSMDAFLTPIERVLTRCLPQPQYVKLNRGSLLRTNQLDRYRGYEIATRIGLQTPNEQRALEDLPPVPWGDKPYVAAKQQPTAAGDPAQTGATQ